eukprot:tig00000269_g23678.t1
MEVLPANHDREAAAGAKAISTADRDVDVEMADACVAGTRMLELAAPEAAGSERAEPPWPSPPPTIEAFVKPVGNNPHNPYIGPKFAFHSARRLEADDFRGKFLKSTFDYKVIAASGGRETVVYSRAYVDVDADLSEACAGREKLLKSSSSAHRMGDGAALKSLKEHFDKCRTYAEYIRGSAALERVVECAVEIAKTFGPDRKPFVVLGFRGAHVFHDDFEHFCLRLDNPEGASSLRNEISARFSRVFKVLSEEKIACISRHVDEGVWSRGQGLRLPDARNPKSNSYCAMIYPPLDPNKDFLDVPIPREAPDPRAIEAFSGHLRRLHDYIAANYERIHPIPSVGESSHGQPPSALPVPSITIAGSDVGGGSSECKEAFDVAFRVCEKLFPDGHRALTFTSRNAKTCNSGRTINYFNFVTVPNPLNALQGECPYGLHHKTNRALVTVCGNGMPGVFRASVRCMSSQCELNHAIHFTTTAYGGPGEKIVELEKNFFETLNAMLHSCVYESDLPPLPKLARSLDAVGATPAEERDVIHPYWEVLEAKVNRLVIAVYYGSKDETNHMACVSLLDGKVWVKCRYKSLNGQDQTETCNASLSRVDAAALRAAFTKFDDALYLRRQVGSGPARFMAGACGMELKRSIFFQNPVKDQLMAVSDAIRTNVLEPMLSHSADARPDLSFASPAVAPASPRIFRHPIDQPLIPEATRPRHLHPSCNYKVIMIDDLPHLGDGVMVTRLRSSTDPKVALPHTIAIAAGCGAQKTRAVLADNPNGLLNYLESQLLSTATASEPTARYATYIANGRAQGEVDENSPLHAQRFRGYRDGAGNAKEKSRRDKKKRLMHDRIVVCAESFHKAENVKNIDSRRGILIADELNCLLGRFSSSETFNGIRKKSWKRLLRAMRRSKSVIAMCQDLQPWHLEVLASQVPPGETMVVFQLSSPESLARYREEVHVVVPIAWSPFFSAACLPKPATKSAKGRPVIRTSNLHADKQHMFRNFAVMAALNPQFTEKRVLLGFADCPAERRRDLNDAEKWNTKDVIMANYVVQVGFDGHVFRPKFRLMTDAGRTGGTDREVQANNRVRHLEELPSANHVRLNMYCQRFSDADKEATLPVDPNAIFSSAWAGRLAELEKGRSDLFQRERNEDDESFERRWREYVEEERLLAMVYANVTAERNAHHTWPDRMLVEKLMCHLGAQRVYIANHGDLLERVSLDAKEFKSLVAEVGRTGDAVYKSQEYAPNLLATTPGISFDCRFHGDFVRFVSKSGDDRNGSGNSLGEEFGISQDDATEEYESAIQAVLNKAQVSMTLGQPLYATTPEDFMASKTIESMRRRARLGIYLTQVDEPTYAAREAKCDIDNVASNSSGSACNPFTRVKKSTEMILATLGVPELHPLHPLHPFNFHLPTIAFGSIDDVKAAGLARLAASPALVDLKIVEGPLLARALALRGDTGASDGAIKAVVEEFEASLASGSKRLPSERRPEEEALEDAESEAIKMAASDTDEDGGKGSEGEERPSKKARTAEDRATLSRRLDSCLYRVYRSAVAYAIESLGGKLVKVASPCIARGKAPDGSPVEFRINPPGNVADAARLAVALKPQTRNGSPDTSEQYESDVRAYLSANSAVAAALRCMRGGGKVPDLHPSALVPQQLRQIAHPLWAPDTEDEIKDLLYWTAIPGPAEGSEYVPQYAALDYSTAEGARRFLECVSKSKLAAALTIPEDFLRRIGAPLDTPSIAEIAGRGLQGDPRYTPTGIDRREEHRIACVVSMMRAVEACIAGPDRKNGGFWEMMEQEVEIRPLCGPETGCARGEHAEACKVEHVRVGGAWVSFSAMADANKHIVLADGRALGKDHSPLATELLDALEEGLGPRAPRVLRSNTYKGSQQRVKIDGKEKRLHGHFFPSIYLEIDWLGGGLDGPAPPPAPAPAPAPIPEFEAVTAPPAPDCIPAPGTEADAMQI